MYVLMKNVHFTTSQLQICTPTHIHTCIHTYMHMHMYEYAFSHRFLKFFSLFSFSFFAMNLTWSSILMDVLDMGMNVLFISRICCSYYCCCCCCCCCCIYNIILHLPLLYLHQRPQRIERNTNTLSI